jgi:predicted flap endonuclease-1-like 5' DNA nuclease
MTRQRWGLVILVLLPILGLLALLIWWWLCQRESNEAVLTLKVREVTPVRVGQPSKPEVLTVPTAADDLTRIKGIGPKISGVLQGAGICTFADLAATDVSRLEQILTKADIRLADPQTWPEQASLAAAGQ